MQAIKNIMQFQSDALHLETITHPETHPQRAVLLYVFTYTNRNMYKSHQCNTPPPPMSNVLDLLYAGK